VVNNDDEPVLETKDFWVNSDDEPVVFGGEL